MACPANAVVYNGSLCACHVGHLLDRTAERCVLYAANSTISTDRGVDFYSISFPERIFEFDSIKKFTQSQAVFLEATLVLVLSWLAFCVFLRFMKLGGDGRSIWFNLRWWVSRLDISFSTRHWLDDQKVVKKRKTELGGAFSIASWIVFIGLVAALLYQVISRRTIEVHNVRATNGPDIALFVNDMEINITTVSNMTCSNLRDLGTLVVGNPGLIDYAVVPLSNFGDYSCRNSSEGPTISLRCSGCQPLHDNVYISWHFVDLPNSPATAVGFRFNLTTRSHNDRKHLSFVSGFLKNGSKSGERPVTFRGKDSNVLKFSLFPRIYRNLKDLRLIQPLFHEFVPGSRFYDSPQLQTSLGRPGDGVINTTLSVNFLSSYIVEIDDQNIMGPVSFLADLGGLYCISIGFFFFLLVQCEFRVKRLRSEDRVLRRLRNRRKAMERWDKLRKYVMFTFGCTKLEEIFNKKNTSSCSGGVLNSLSSQGSSRKHRQMSRKDSISLNKKVPSTSLKNTVSVPECSAKSGATSSLPRTSPSLKPQNHEVVSLNGIKSGYSGNSPQLEELSLTLTSGSIPPPPLLELEDGSELDMCDVQRNLKSLYEYNVMLRDKFEALQSVLHGLATQNSSAGNHDTS